ncbi:fluoride efflux transporter CrcB [Gemmatimonas phototrophica]|uniref:fluoride efflux transporter CrcB n=1 Tax=Gemmatimonas phototrophica TaxID=1379270 RepID=UPI0006A755BB|nr:fluoride efflux transporter CrcB [Gemmatimonas phototrophica]
MPSVAALLAVALGGAVGSVARYVTTLALTPVTATFPYATLLVNVIGSFLIGYFGRVFSTPEHDPVVRLALTTGLCGGFTTFSALSAETVTLLQQGRTGRAMTYIALSLALGLGATALGLMAGRK